MHLKYKKSNLSKVEWCNLMKQTHSKLGGCTRVAGAAFWCLGRPNFQTFKTNFQKNHVTISRLLQMSNDLTLAYSCSSCLADAMVVDRADYQIVALKFVKLACN